jgi:hypothetical protein
LIHSCAKAAGAKNRVSKKTITILSIINTSSNYGLRPKWSIGAME